MHIKTIMLLMCLEVLGERFFWKRLRYIAYPDVLDMKYRWELKLRWEFKMALLITAACLQSFTRFSGKKTPPVKRYAFFSSKCSKCSKCFICFNESALKMMKSAFYFISFYLKLSILKIIEFFCWLFGHVKNPGLIRKIRLTLKFMTS